MVYKINDLFSTNIKHVRSCLQTGEIIDLLKPQAPRKATYSLEFIFC